MFPYMEQEGLSDQYNFDLNFSNNTIGSTGYRNSDLIQKDIPTFLCPSAPMGRKQYLTVPNNIANIAGVTDYSPTSAGPPANAFLTITLPPAPLHPLVSNQNTLRGVLGQNLLRPVNWVTDGTSNTMAFAEDAGRPQTWVLGKQAAPDHPPTPAGFRAAIGGWSQPTNLINVAGTLPGVAPPTPCFPGPIAVNGNNGEDIYAFHPGGANILMTDGAVRFLRNTVSINTVGMLLVPNDGLTVPQTAF
jgi:prepilin-type processing-associated H-X9-DG protein